MTVPSTLSDLGQTVRDGEQMKTEQYEKFYRFPDGVRFVPFVIDSHGRLGMQAIRELKAMCLRSTGGVVNNLYANVLPG